MECSKISIIVPVYNVEKYLRRCIESILSLTYTNFELLLVDDGSKDKSGEICDEYARKDSRIRVLHKENGGVSSARNLGLTKAINEWICFVDADDELCPDYLEKFSEGILRYDADMYICGFNYVSDHIQKLYKMDDSVWSKSRFLSLYLLYQPQGKFGVPWNKCFRKSIIDQHQLQFDIKVKRAEDELFNLQFMKYAKSVVCLPVVTYIYYRFDVPTGANTYQDFDERLYVSTLLMDNALELQTDENSIIMVRQLFINNIVLAVKELYWKYNYWHFSMIERYNILKRVRQIVHDKNYTRFYHKALKQQYLFCDNFLTIEFFGFLLYLRYKFIKK